MEIEPRLADQELSVGTRYWEGAVAVSGSSDGRAIAGQGYVELVGYGERQLGSAENVGESERDVRERERRHHITAGDTLGVLEVVSRRPAMDLDGLALEIGDPVVTTLTRS